MSAAGVGVCELQEVDIARMFKEDGSFRLPAAQLPAVFYSQRLRQNSDFERFCTKYAPLQFERYPQGEILVMAPAHSNSGHLELVVGSRLIMWAETDGRGLAFGPSSGFDLSDGCVLAPDASWIALNRWNALTREQQQDFAPLCPDFVIEIRSASDRVKQLEAKMRLWLEHSAKLAWMIDPKRKLAVVYRQDREPEAVEQPDVLRGEGPVAGFELEMKRFWA